jgi:Holliday junction resolvase
MTSKSKNKGKGFEREVCKILGEVYGDNFERVPHSGAFVGGVNAARKSTLTENQIKAFKGDIIPPDHWKHFNCECKNYKDFPFHHLLQNKAIPLLESWLEQTLDAHDDRDIDLLFMKFDRKGIYLAFPKRHKTKFFLDRHITYQSENHGHWTITFWEDFKATTINTDAIETMAIKGTD